MLSRFWLPLALLGLALVKTPCEAEGLPSEPRFSIHERPQERLAKVVAYCKALNPYHAGQYRTYLIRLAQQGEYELLRGIYASAFVFSEWAAAELGAVLPAKKALALCKSLRVGSPPWREAFSTLGHQAKKDVIDYVKRVVKDRNPYARYACYKLCLCKGWDDVLPNAEADRNDESYLGIPNNSDAYVLGQVATSYIQHINQLKAAVARSKPSQ